MIPMAGIVYIVAEDASECNALCRLLRDRVLFLGDSDILKVVKYRQDIKGVKDEENNMSVYWTVNVDRMFDKTLYNIK